MRRPKAPTEQEPGALPAALQPLVDQLTKLTERERLIVIRAVAAAAERGREGPAKEATPQLLVQAFGVLSIGGDAVEDCRALFDG